ncbi:MAG: hypothetical protein ACO3MW_04425 [Rhodospirillales bacterium]
MKAGFLATLKNTSNGRKMQMIQKILSSATLLIVSSMLVTTLPAFAASTQKTPLHIAVPAIQVTNHLNIDKSEKIIRPYLRVRTKKDLMTACHYMPRVREALFMALNTPMFEKLAVENRELALTAALSQAAAHVTPKHTIMGVLAFNVHDLNDYRAEKKLTGKTPCPKK